MRFIQSLLRENHHPCILFQYFNHSSPSSIRKRGCDHLSEAAWASHALIDPPHWLNVPSALHGPGDRKDRYSPTRRNDWSSSKTPSLPPPKQNNPAEEKSGIMISFKRLVTAPASQQHSYGNEGRQIWNNTRPSYQACVCVAVLRMRYNEDVTHSEMCFSKTDPADILVGFTLQHLQYQLWESETQNRPSREREPYKSTGRSKKAKPHLNINECHFKLYI